MVTKNRLTPRATPGSAQELAHEVDSTLQTEWNEGRWLENEAMQVGVRYHPQLSGPVLMPKATVVATCLDSSQEAGEWGGVVILVMITIYELLGEDTFEVAWPLELAVDVGLMWCDPPEPTGR